MDLVKARLAYVREELEEVLSKLDDSFLDWAPGEGMRTVAGQLVEIAITEVQIVANLRDGVRVSDTEAKARLAPLDSLADLRKALDTVRRETLAYIDSEGERGLCRDVPLPTPWYGSMDLPAAPRMDILKNIAQHEYYHVGQLVSYLWARGDDPYKW